MPTCHAVGNMTRHRRRVFCGDPRRVGEMRFAQPRTICRSKPEYIRTPCQNTMSCPWLPVHIGGLVVSSCSELRRRPPQGLAGSRHSPTRCRIILSLSWCLFNSTFRLFHAFLSPADQQTRNTARAHGTEKTVHHAQNETASRNLPIPSHMPLPRHTAGMA